MNRNKMHVIILESDTGFDCFGNPTGEPIIMETNLKDSCRHTALDRAAAMQLGGRKGRVLIAEVNVVGEVIGGNLILGEAK